MGKWIGWSALIVLIACFIAGGVYSILTETLLDRWEQILGLTMLGLFIVFAVCGLLGKMD